MVLSHEDDEERHPYWYARVVRIFHLDVWYYGGENAVASKPLRMHVLFVRWFGRDVSFKGGWSAKRLHRLGFLKGDDPTCFVFLDPDQVIRGVHLIPAFAHDRVTDHYMGPSFVRREQDGNKDWRYHYVNMCVPLYILNTCSSYYCTRFVDRDMFMRFRGGGVGHKVTREWDDFLQNDGAPNISDDDEIWDIDMDASAIVDVEEDEEEEESESDEAVDEDDDEKGKDDDEDKDEDDDEEDWVQADSDEELDDDVLAREGYGAL